jgi:hypothetical protein
VVNQCGTDLRSANERLAYVHSVDGDGLMAIARRRTYYAPIWNSVEEREVPPQHLRREHCWWGQPGGHHVGRRSVLETIAVVRGRVGAAMLATCRNKTASRDVASAAR